MRTPLIVNFKLKLYGDSAHTKKDD